METRRRYLALLALVAAAAACGPDSSDRLTEPFTVSQPLFVDGDLVYVAPTIDQLLVLSPQKGSERPTLDISRSATGKRPGVFTLSHDETEVFIVNEDDKTLGIHSIADGGNRVATVELESAYDRIVVDPEGEFLVLAYSGIARPDVVALNLNEVGIVDLRSSPPTTRFVTLASFATDFVFAPAFELGGEPRRLVAAMAENEVTLVDLLADDGENLLREVPLTLSEADQVRRPLQALFDTEPSPSLPDTAFLYVLTDSASDVTQVAIQPGIAPDEDLALSVNQPVAGNAPGRMALLRMEDGDTRLLTIDRTAPKFSLVDTFSGDVATFDLPMPAPAQGLMVYDVPDGDGVERRVLAYSPNAPLVAVIRPETISLAGDEPTLGRSVEAIRLQRAPSRVEASSTESMRAIVFHAGSQSGATILDLERNIDIPIQGQEMRDIFFDGGSALVTYTTFPAFSVFDEEGHPTNYDLEEPATRIFLDSGDGLIVTQHPGLTGHFTVLDAADPVPANATIVHDVFLDGLFQQVMP